MQAKTSFWLCRLRDLAVCLLLSLLALPLGSCTAITGFATGAPTGFVDLPSTLISEEYPNTDPMDDADFWMASIVLAPIGFAIGPVIGFFKGLAIDINWVSGKVSYGDVYGSYDNESIWRPFKFDWIDD